MLADDVTRTEIEALVRETYRRMSTPVRTPASCSNTPT